MLLTSCSIHMRSTQGSLLSVDESGFFPEDQVYQFGHSHSISFGTDGSYDASFFYYEDGSDSDGDGISNIGWMQTNGEKGTYHYDPNTLTMSLSLSHHYLSPSIGQSYIWAPLTNSMDVITREFFAAAFEHTYYANNIGMSVFKIQPDGRLSGSHNYQNYAGEHYLVTRTFTLNTDTQTYSNLESTSIFDVTNNLNYILEILNKGTLSSVSPEGLPWEEGQCLTYHVTTDARKYRAWYSSSWMSWIWFNFTPGDQIREDLVFSHLGTFVILTPDAHAAQGISLREVF